MSIVNFGLGIAASGLPEFAGCNMEFTDAAK